MFDKGKLVAVFLAVLMIFSLAGCSKTTNIFRWAHKGGSDTSKESLLADGQAALSSKDFNDALTYYNKLLESNPNSSEAMYGKAQALIGLGGLSPADLIASVVKEAQSTGNSAVIANSEFAAFFSSARYVSSATDLLPSTLNLTQLYKTAKTVVPVLKDIADGKGDGVIPADDPDVNINLAFFMLVQSVCRFLDSDRDDIPGDSHGDIIKVYSDFSMTVPDFTALTSGQKKILRDQMQAGVDDAFGIDPATYGAINYMERVIKKIGSKSGSSISDLRANIAKLKNDIHSEIDTNINPKLSAASIALIVWQPHASVL
ncbi:MAG: hypothetical protein HY920_02950 [Elusimicrobia bacterium]|nr:hypothetical protein [Elusimicrobiota bacterium]